MAATKLVIIEGIPGSGKTTAARFVRDWLAERGLQTRLYLEGDLDHPADFESVACLSRTEYIELLEEFPAEGSFLEEHKQVVRGEVFFAYRKLQNEFGDRFPQALFADLARYEIYELPEDKFLRLTFARWADFTAQTSGAPETFIFECCFLQNQLTTYFARFNQDLRQASRNIMQLAAVVRPLNPLIIYLEPPGVRPALEKVAASRPREWLDYVIRYTTGQGWGLEHAQAGFDGMVNFYQMRRDAERVIFPQLPWHGLWLENAGLDWDADYRRIADFLAAFYA